MMNFRKAAALSMAIMLGAAGAVSVSAANPESAAETVSTAEAPAEEGFVIISNQYFGVTVPVSLCDLMDIVSTNNGIKFYQKSARETCGGFIGEIMVFGNTRTSRTTREAARSAIRTEASWMSCSSTRRMCRRISAARSPCRSTATL